MIEPLERSVETPESGQSKALEAHVDEKLPAGRTLALGFQHVLVMYSGAVAVPLILGAAIGLTKAQIAFLISADLFTCGIATLLQTLGLTKHIGIKMPLMMGVTFAALQPMIIIGQDPRLGMPYIYGAILLSSIIAFFLSGYFGKLKSLFPPVVTGVVVTTIGLSLIPNAITWAAGGNGAPDYGSPVHLLLALGVLALILLITHFFKGFIGNIAVMLGMIVGMVAAHFLGKLNLSGIAAEPWVHFPAPFWFGVPKFDLSATICMVIVTMVCFIESTGVFIAIGKIVHEDVTHQQITRGLRAETFATFIGSILNSFPYITFSQNLGLVAMTRIGSRFVVATAGGILIFLGLLPKFGALVAAVPPAVLGGASIVMFGMVAVSGLRMLQQVDFEETGNQLTVAVSIGIGLGVSAVPSAFAGLSENCRFFLSNGIIVSAILSVVLNWFFNRKREA